ERYLPQLAEVASQLDRVRTVVVPDLTTDSGSAAGSTDPSTVGRSALPPLIDGAAFFAGAEPATDFVGPDYWDVASIIYTSGTTGPSKGVLMPWGTLYSFVTTAPDDFVAPGEGFYAMYPAFHVSGKAMLYQASYFRARMVLREQFSITHFWD